MHAKVGATASMEIKHPRIGAFCLTAQLLSQRYYSEFLSQWFDAAHLPRLQAVCKQACIRGNGADTHVGRREPDPSSIRSSIQSAQKSKSSKHAERDQKP